MLVLAHLNHNHAFSEFPGVSWLRLRARAARLLIHLCRFWLWCCAARELYQRRTQQQIAKRIATLDHRRDPPGGNLRRFDLANRFMPSWIELRADFDLNRLDARAAERPLQLNLYEGDAVYPRVAAQRLRQRGEGALQCIERGQEN